MRAKSLYLRMLTCSLFYFLAGFVVVFHASGQEKAVRLAPVDQERVRQIAGFLSDVPRGFAEPVTGRGYWERLRKGGNYDKFLAEMAYFVFPEFSAADYFSLSDGTASSSGRGLTMMRNRARALSRVVLAECLENKGKYLPVIEEGLGDMLRQKSWVSPRVDFDFINYNGKQYTIDLTSALYAHTIAQTLYLLDSRLSPKLKKDALEALYARVFHPLMKIFDEQDTRYHTWLTGTNNWNAVCLSGVVGAALTVIPDKNERAVYAYIGEHYSQNTLAGFGEDGYCSEGVTYFNYGVSHYALLRENLLIASSGKIDLFTIPKVRAIAEYVPKLEIMNGVFPAISDSKAGSSPDSSLMCYLSRSLGLGLKAYENVRLEGRNFGLRVDAFMMLGNSPVRETQGESQTDPVRSYFEKSGILVTRPATGSGLGAALKGGHNAEHHNHNDVGSYTVAAGRLILAGDPGSIPYTADIFTPEHRYTYKSIGSYGHPVPLVAGRQQSVGAKAGAKVVEEQFAPEKDIFTMDLSACYDVPELRKLERRFTYERVGKGSLEVLDTFEFTEPRDFETAWITRSSVKEVSPGRWLLEAGGEKVLVEFDSFGLPYRVSVEQISEGGEPYSRFSARIDGPRKSGKVKLTYRIPYSPLETPMISIDYGSLLKVKAQIAKGEGGPAHRALEKLVQKAEELLSAEPEKVTDGDLPPSGDVHEFYAIGKLAFPNPDTPDGLPYIRKDGVTNPEADGDRYDLARYNRTLSRVNLLSLAWFFTEDEKYARKAAGLLRVWFFDPDTRMNPSLDNASALPGVHDGMPIGIIFGVAMIRMADHVRLLTLSESWTEEDHRKLKQWFAAYRDWLLTSDLGKKEGLAANNHGSWYAAQVAAFSIFNQQYDQAAPMIDLAKKQLVEQLAPDGSMPREYVRQRSLHYSVYGLQAFIYLARCGEIIGRDLWNYQGPDSKGIALALQFLYPYITYSKEWPWENIEKGNPPGRGALEVFQWGAIAYPGSEWSPMPASIWKEMPGDSADYLYWPREQPVR